MEFLKQLGILIIWLGATVATWFGFSWLDFTYKLTDGNDPLWGPVYTGLYLACLTSICAGFAHFFSSVRPLFSSATVRGLGCALGLSGVLVVFLPLIIASASTPSGGNMFDESTGGGAAIWLMFFSIPAGIILGILGIRVVRANSADKTNQEASLLDEAAEANPTSPESEEN